MPAAIEGLSIRTAGAACLHCERRMHVQARGGLADRLLQMAQGPHRLALDLVQLAQNLDIAQLVEVELPFLLRCADLQLQVCHLQKRWRTQCLSLPTYTAGRTSAITQLLDISCTGSAMLTVSFLFWTIFEAVYSSC